MPENLGRLRRMLVYRGAGVGRFLCMHVCAPRVLPVGVIFPVDRM